MTAAHPSARFDDLTEDTSWVFDGADEVLTADRLDQVRDTLERVEAATARGQWAWGYVSYEAAPAFDDALRVRAGHDPERPIPLARFAIGPAPRIGPAIPAPVPNLSELPAAARSGIDPDWSLGWTQEQHRIAVETIRAAIAAGDAYQVNVTTGLTGHTGAGPVDLYRTLVHAQRGGHNALLDFGERFGPGVIVSASPESFFRWETGALTVRPMKGTARRGATTEADLEARTELRSSPKQRAENLMIVDLLRNDLSRVAVPGTVQVASLFDVERYESVWQMTSTVTAEPRPEVGLPELFEALFPCGSVTGAPKASAMGLIADTEDTPRGVYCGAIGMVAPPGSPFRARFSVAIRTAVVDRATGALEYGTGGGITWQSDPAQEWDEVLAKAAILTAPPATGFRLLETMRLTADGGLRNLSRHRRRLLDSAAYFGFRVDPDEFDAWLLGASEAARAEPGTAALRVRVLLARDGALRFEHSPFTEIAVPVRLALDERPTPTGPFSRHKTTRRDLYEAAARRHPNADDVVLFDHDEAAIETTRANLIAHLDGRWCTPALAVGCLPGVERERLVEAGRVTERRLTRADLRRAKRLAVVSSLRGVLPAVVMPPLGHTD